jgi:hypothetical protein
MKKTDHNENREQKRQEILIVVVTRERQIGLSLNER